MVQANWVQSHLGQARWLAVTAALMGATVITGCTSSRIGALETRPASTQPAPLNAAPSGTVTSGQLPPPVSPDAANNPAFPEAPTSEQTETLADNGDVVTGSDAGSSSVTQVASAAPVTREAMGGVWTTNSAGTTCRIATSLTKGGNDFRAASLGCGGELSSLGFWNLSGNRVILKDRNGQQVATLFASGNNRFEGQTAGGRAVSMSR